MLDFVGNPITAGCKIVYPARRGSSMWLNLLTVTQIDEQGIKGYNKLGRRITLTNLEFIVVVHPKVPNGTN